MFSTRITLGAIALGASAALLAGASAASASPRVLPQKVTAVTFVQDRPDSGHASYWADDTMLRTLVITPTGGVAGAYTFTATLKDTGTFTTIKGVPAPNQGGSYAGDVIKGKVTGGMTGYADFSFTASVLPDAAPNAGVPGYENDHGNLPSDSTSTWYELAFPAGTTFTGGIGDWSWSYSATVRTVTFRTFCLTSHFCWSFPVIHVSHQHWVDAWNNGDGDLAGDGQITG